MARIKVNGIELAYEVSGDGPALLLIHGLGSSLQDWDAQVATFSGQYRVIRFDLRGHGQSDKPAGPYSMPMFAADAAGLLRELGIDAAHVVGISLGGAIAFQLAVDHPAQVKTLTIVNSGPAALMQSMKEKFAIWLRFFIVRRMGMAKLAKAIGPRLFPQPENQAVCAAFMARMARNDPQAYLHALQALVGWSVAAKIGAIGCPVLAIAADQDYTPLSMKQAFVAQIPGAKLAVVTDSRHALPMEKPAQFNAVLQEFLAFNSQGIALQSS